MFFFKEVQTVRQRRGAIANLDLVYNSRNASIVRRKGNFDWSQMYLQPLAIKTYMNAIRYHKVWSIIK